MQEAIFSNIKVIELASVLAGPLAGSFFAELGATVIKIENKITGGDVTRQWKLASEDPDTPISAYYASANTGKQILKLDLRNDVDYDSLMNLIETADIVISNYQKNTAEKLKIDYGTIFNKNKSIIFAQLSAYSYDDPKPGYDLIMQAETGFISMNGISKDGLAKMPVALIDVIAGHQIKESILIALLTKREKEEGLFIDISLYKSAISALANQASNYLMNDHIPVPLGTLHPNIAPYGDIVKSLDGHEIMLAIGSDAQFKKLGKTLNFTEKELSTFKYNYSRLSNRIQLSNLLKLKVGKMHYNDLEREFKELKIPFCKIVKLNDVFDNQLAKEMVIENNIEQRQTSRVSNIAFNIKRI